jgi:hypothetical protein
MKLAWAVRILLALVLVWDLPALIYLLGYLGTGGLRAVDGWVAHVALEGRLSDTSIEQKGALVRQAYAMFALMILVAPPALYLLQRWLMSRSTVKKSD